MAVPQQVLRKLAGPIGAVLIALTALAGSLHPAKESRRPAARGGLSPAGWPAADRARLQQMERSPSPPVARTIEGRNGLVVATLSPIATHAGMQALHDGGTAADAALTTALTQVATNLGAVVSYAGVLQLVYFDAQSKRVYSLDAGWGSYREETDPASIPGADVSQIVTGRSGSAATPGRKTLVPGFMAGVEAAHKRFGQLPLADLFKPAIWYSANGVEVTPLLAAWFSMQQGALSRTPAGQQFLHQAQAGRVPQAGNSFVQPRQAALLESVAAHGAQVMYTGDWAREFVQAVRAEGGKATLEDLKHYSPAWETPLKTTYGELTVFGPGETNASGCPILEMLNVLHALELRERGPYWSDPQTFMAITKSLQLATVGHYDPRTREFEQQQGIESTCSARVEPRYARAVAPALDELSGYGATAQGHHHSASVVAIDRWGNVAALTHSSNSVVWGDTGLVVGGVPLPNAGGIYQERLRAAGPGERIPGDMAPVIALKHGRPAIAAASIGVSVVPETVRVVASAARQDADLAAVVAAPPLLLNIDPVASPLAARPAAVPSGVYDESFLERLRRLSLEIAEVPSSRTLGLRGTSALAVIDGEGRAARTAETPGVFVFAEAD